MSSTQVRAGSATEIRPFQVDVPQAELDELRRRIQATRWPETETVADQSQGQEPEIFTNELRAAFRTLR